MSQLILLLVAISNLAGGIEIASDIELGSAATAGIAIDTEHREANPEDPHADEEGCEHCAHASAHLLGFAAIELAAQPGREAHQFATEAGHFRSRCSRPAVPPNIHASV